MSKIISTDRNKKTNWYVITCGPSSGKTTTLNILNKKGYNTTIEHARHYLDRNLN
jgi:predicted ATPase